EVADTRLHVQLPVGTDGHDGIPSDRARPMRADGDADAANLGTAALAAARLACFPAEDLDAFVERFFDARARHMRAHPVRTGRTVDRFTCWRVGGGHRHLSETPRLRDC